MAKIRDMLLCTRNKNTMINEQSNGLSTILNILAIIIANTIYVNVSCKIGK